MAKIHGTPLQPELGVLLPLEPGVDVSHGAGPKVAEEQPSFGFGILVALYIRVALEAPQKLVQGRGTPLARIDRDAGKGVCAGSGGGRDAGDRGSRLKPIPRRLAEAVSLEWLDAQVFGEEPRLGGCQGRDGHVRLRQGLNLLLGEPSLVSEEVPEFLAVAVGHGDVQDGVLQRI